MEDDRHQSNLISRVDKALKIYESFITRIEVHLSNGEVKNEGDGQVECRMEARLKNRSHIDVANKDNTIELAASGAIHKLNASLGRLLVNIHYQ